MNTTVSLVNLMPEDAQRDAVEQSLAAMAPASARNVLPNLPTTTLHSPGPPRFLSFRDRAGLDDWLMRGIPDLDSPLAG